MRLLASCLGMIVSASLILAALMLAPLALVTAAEAHPHIWVTTRAALLYGPDGRVTGVRHSWTFDSGYSAYATEGLVVDGRLDPAKAAELAKLNTESLAESGYFTELRAGGARQAFADPRDADVALDRDGLLVLDFTLPLKSPTAAKRLLLDVSDPSFFVDFSIAAGDAVALTGAPAGCEVTIQRPKPPAPDKQPLSEAFFQALDAGANYGAQFANRTVVTCR